MAVFNETVYQNLTNVTQIFDVAQSFTEGGIGLGFWIMISVGAFFLMGRYDNKSGLVAASFISIVVGIFLTYIGLLAGIYIMIALVLYIIAMIVLITAKPSLGA